MKLGARLTAPPAGIVPGPAAAGGGMPAPPAPSAGLVGGVMAGAKAPTPFYGSGYTGLGDGDNGRAAGLYGWLDDDVKTRMKADNQYQMLAGDGQAVKLGDYLDAFKAADGRYVIKPHKQITHTKSGNLTEIAGEYGSREDMRRALGFAGAGDDMMVGFSNARSGGGDASGGVLSPADALALARRQASGAIHSDQREAAREASAPASRAYMASSDPQYKGFVQLGNVGPLNDDIGKMLPAIYAQVEATTPEQQRQVRNALFKYDDRYGLMANEQLVQAALGQNKNRSKGWLQDLVKFEAFNFKKMAGQIKDNPARLLYGSADPFSTKVWNGVLGTNDKPILNQMGGASDEAWREAAAKGINLGPAKTMHAIASTIAAFYGARGIGNAMGGGQLASAAGKGVVQAGMNNGQVDWKGLVMSYLGQNLPTGVADWVNGTGLGQWAGGYGVNLGQLAGSSLNNLALGKKVDGMQLGLQAAGGLVSKAMQGR